MKYWFTADEHMGHENVIKYCNRPFKSVTEMDEEIIGRFNEVVGRDDVVIHIGDFTLKGNALAENYVRRLNGVNTFLRGSHDYWMDRTYHEIWEKEINGIYIVCCHYQMVSWPRSFHGSVQLYGHSHGRSSPAGGQMDVGVDCNNFYPVVFEEVVKKLIK